MVILRELGFQTNPHSYGMDHITGAMDGAFLLCICYLGCGKLYCCCEQRDEQQRGQSRQGCGQVLHGKAEAAGPASGRARRGFGSHPLLPKVGFLAMNICWKEKEAGAGS